MRGAKSELSEPFFYTLTWFYSYIVINKDKSASQNAEEMTSLTAVFPKTSIVA